MNLGMKLIFFMCLDIHKYMFKSFHLCGCGQAHLGKLKCGSDYRQTINLT